jgi:hypothetical protein
MKNIWYIWCKALGDKPHEDNSTADKIAIIRTLIVLVYIITNIFIVCGVIKHWND